MKPRLLINIITPSPIAYKSWTHASIAVMNESLVHGRPHYEAEVTY